MEYIWSTLFLMKRTQSTEHHNKQLLIYKVIKENKTLDYFYYTIKIPNQKTLKDKPTQHIDNFKMLCFCLNSI